MIEYLFLFILSFIIFSFSFPYSFHILFLYPKKFNIHN